LAARLLNNDDFRLGKQSFCIRVFSRDWRADPDSFVPVWQFNIVGLPFVGTPHQVERDLPPPLKLWRATNAMRGLRRLGEGGRARLPRGTKPRGLKSVSVSTGRAVGLATADPCDPWSTTPGSAFAFVRARKNPFSAAAKWSGNAPWREPGRRSILPQ